MAICLSPNGSYVFKDTAPPTQLLVGTFDGITVLERQGSSPEWKITGHAFERSAHQLCALGTHPWRPLCRGPWERPLCQYGRR